MYSITNYKSNKTTQYNIIKEKIEEREIKKIYSWLINLTPKHWSLIKMQNGRSANK